MSVAVLSLGSNVADRAANMAAMQEEIQKISITRIICSPLYESEAVDVAQKQENYYNKIIRIETNETPQSLLDITQKIETKLGRTSKSSKLPRTADIDILLFGCEIILTEKLTIPHPRMFFRKFAVEGIKFVGADLINPFSGELFADYRVPKEILLQKVKIIG
jgi:2-amino-4-hydroxy-6-hydroxymethyldihydropteridine diphosphokinase